MARLGAAGAPGIRAVDDPCFLCGTEAADGVWETPDRAFGVPGTFRVVRCRGCGFLYQRPRVADDALSACYPGQYPRHQEPSPRIPFRGSARRLRAVRYALSRWLGYSRFRDPRPGLLTMLRARWLRGRLEWECLPWTGEGRHLDVGCGSGAALGVARALGWRVAGIEMAEAAAARARRFTDDLHVGDVLSAPFEDGRFDVVTAFHVLEHVPDPVAVLRRMLGWLAPGGLLIVEVPNAGGLGASLFGPAWSGLELPRHLSHFAPASLRRAVALAGGRVVWERQRAKPRHYLWSLRHWLRDRGLEGLARASERAPVRGLLKLSLEIALPAVGRAGRGEVVRIGARQSTADRVGATGGGAVRPAREGRQ
jgi:SAM-dependent methyltransferase